MKLFQHLLVAGAAASMIAPLAEKVITQRLHENASLDKGPESAPVHLGLPPEALLALRASPEGRGVPP